MSKEYLSKPFAEQLKTEGYRLPDMLREWEEKENGGLNKVVQRWTGLPFAIVKRGEFEEKRDELLPIIEESIQAFNSWWRERGGEEPPMLTAKELSRRTGISVQKIVATLSLNPIELGMWSVSCLDPTLSKNRLPLTESRKYGVSPKGILRDARYLSRSPGGGPVQKARIDERKIDPLLRKAIYQRVPIQFEPITVSVQQKGTENPSQRIKEPTFEELIYQEPDGEKIMKVFDWFKKVGYGKKWVYKNEELKFAKKLIDFSQGKPIDWLMWNCIGFTWYGNNGKMPSCDLTNNLNASITLYFQNRIIEMVNQLSTIGNPRLYILLPSNEAFDEAVWNYRQPYESRKSMLREAVAGLREAYSTIYLPANVDLRIVRWDVYLRSRKAANLPPWYSSEGKNRLQADPAYEKIAKRALKNGKNYYEKWGIFVDDKELLEKQVDYYAVYGGEGIAYQELSKSGIDIVLVNFEEWTVVQEGYRGSNNSLCAVTPISAAEMSQFYAWKNEQTKLK
ncbi:hypothetical protein HGA88_03370 [Candidatus Roizmanbacteria bacterium]|nr:hypothetical protein [Candidatus Roizmanbacteria bacterium]